MFLNVNRRAKIVEIIQTAHGHSLRSTGLLMLLVATLIVAPLVGRGQEYSISKGTEGKTIHSEQMQELLASVRYDHTDRTLDALNDVHQSLRVVRDSIKRIRASLLHSPSEAPEQELANYVKAAQSLVAIKKAVESIQTHMSQCTTVCAQAELAVAEGRPAPADHFTKMTQHTNSSSEAHKVLRQELASLEAAAKDSGNARLINLVKGITKEADALGKAISLCETSIKESKHQLIQKPESQGAALEKTTNPQTTCPVMGGGIKKGIYADHEGKRVYFCCSSCVGKFKTNPEKYIKQLEDKGVTLEKAPAVKD